MLERQISVSATPFKIKSVVFPAPTKQCREVWIISLTLSLTLPSLQGVHYGLNFLCVPTYTYKHTFICREFFIYFYVHYSSTCFFNLTCHRHIDICVDMYIYKNTYIYTLFKKLDGNHSGYGCTIVCHVFSITSLLMNIHVVSNVLSLQLILQ